MLPHEGRDHPEPIELRHLYVEKQQVHRPSRAVRLLNRVERLRARGAAVHEIDARVPFQQIS
jgi:hypothetical protein